MLNNIGFPGLVLLVCVITLLYFLVRNYNRYSESGEASRTKYIAVWFLVGFVANIFATIWSEVWVNKFPESILRPQENLLLFACYYVISLALVYCIFIIIHSFFKTIIRKKIIPYIWLGSALGILVSIGQFSAFEMSNMYPDFFAYNVSAVVFLQLLYIGLVSRWIRKNPGFEPQVNAQSTKSGHRKEPKFNSSVVETAKSNADADQSDARIEKSQFVKQSSNAVERLEDQQPTNNNTETPTNDSLQEQSFQNSDILNEPILRMSLDESPEIQQQELREVLHAASKFGDIDEILNLLSQLGFKATRDQDRFKIKDNEGLERVIEGEKNLIIFAKRLSVK